MKLIGLLIVAAFSIVLTAAERVPNSLVPDSTITLTESQEKMVQYEIDKAKLKFKDAQLVFLCDLNKSAAMKERKCKLEAIKQTPRG